MIWSPSGTSHSIPGIGDRVHCSCVRIPVNKKTPYYFIWYIIFMWTWSPSDTLHSIPGIGDRVHCSYVRLPVIKKTPYYFIWYIIFMWTWNPSDTLHSTPGIGGRVHCSYVRLPVIWSEDNVSLTFHNFLGLITWCSSNVIENLFYQCREELCERVYISTTTAIGERVSQRQITLFQKIIFSLLKNMCNMKALLFCLKNSNQN